jgi:hypothetical protein
MATLYRPVLIAALAVAGWGQTAGQTQETPVPVAQRPKPVRSLKAGATGGEMLQVRSGGHVAGFRPDRAYLAARDHALTVEFHGTPGVMPRQLNQAGSTLGDANTKVLYEDLWPGISLTYETNSRGITESTYRLATGANVANIRLRYNVPVSLERNGTLKFRFSTGYFTESSPEAWQEINGKRVPVPVAFKESNGEVGFQLGGYNPGYPLTIDPIFHWHTSRAEGAEGDAIAVDGAATSMCLAISNNGEERLPPPWLETGASIEGKTTCRFRSRPVGGFENECPFSNAGTQPSAASPQALSFQPSAFSPASAPPLIFALAARGS